MSTDHTMLMCINCIALSCPCSKQLCHNYIALPMQVFKLPTRNAPQLGLGRSSRGKENREPKRHPQTYMEAKLGHRPRTRHTSDNISQLPVEKLDKKPALGVSPAVSIMSKSSSGGDLSASLGCYTTAGRGECLFV